MTRNVMAVAFVFAFLMVLLLGGCTWGIDGRTHPYERPAADTFGPVREREPVCDFGILRGTKDMFCREEFKRKEWHLWT